MNKKKILRIIAVSTACLSMGVLALGGCKKGGDGHVHTWSSKYYYDGAEGHYRKSVCIDHATVKEAVEAHDGDTCSKCGYVKGGSGETGVTAVKITGDAEVEVGGRIQLSAAITPAGASATVVWSVESDSEFAEIDASGVLTGKAEGTVTVKAAAGSVSDKFSVNVVKASSETVHVTGVVLDKGTLDLKVGEADQTLTATVKPDNAKDKTYTWSSDNPNVATVSGGVVHAVAAGSANVTVTTNDGGHKATCVVNVKAADPGKDPTTPGGGVETPPDPVIEPVQGGPVITKASAGELESAYVEWTAADNAVWYNVYVSPEGAESWTKLDAPLVRQYKDGNNEYFRADAVGLKAGTYDMKVVPVDGNGKEATEYAAPAEKITVYAHERAGFAFVGNTSNATASGAYNMDGTLRENAIVLYVTNDNYDTVSVDAGGTTVTGIDNILGEGYQSKRGATRPLCIRIIGSIGNGSKLGLKANGDLELKALDQGVTIEGIGNDAMANGWGFHITNASNIEIRNLGVMNMMGGTKDGIGIESKCHHIWVHNCDIFYGNNWGGDQKKGDGSLDTKGSTNITHSYNHFWDTGKCNLQGMEGATDKNDYRITYHHNWYDHSDSRHPRIRRASVHVYNNYFDGNAKYGVGVTNSASAFVENNYFRSTADMKPMMISMQGTDIGSGSRPDDKTFSSEDGGIIKAYGNKFDCPANKLKLIERTKDSPSDMVHFDCYTVSDRKEKVPAGVTALKGGWTYNNFDTAEDMYEYSIDTPDQAKEKVTRYAGRIDGGDLKFDFNDTTEDGNSEIIPELSNMLKQYANNLTLIKIGKED